MVVEVVPYRPAWRAQAAQVIADLACALTDVTVESIEHVGSTSVAGLAAKPILDIDVIVTREHVCAAIEALCSAGYRHQGDLGFSDREAFDAPDRNPRRHVYVCEAGTHHVLNHLAVREVLRARPDLRDEYGSLKLELAADPAMDIDTYIARKSAVLQKVLAASDQSQA